MVIVQCLHCKREVNVFPSRAKTFKFCSQSCRYQHFQGQDHPHWKGGLVDRICQQCGKSFKKKPSSVKTGGGVFCSQKCHYVFKSIQMHGTGNHEWKERVSFVCQQCGVQFERPPYRQGKHKLKFCSRPCYEKWRSINLSGKNSPRWKERIRIECAQCKKIVEKTPGRLKEWNMHFCSRTCQGQWRSENLTGEKSPGWQGGKKTCICQQCGKEFYAIPARLKDRRGKFCSQECKWIWQSFYWRGEKSPTWKGGLSFFPYCEKFNKDFKLRVRAFFGYCCALCGKTEKENGENLCVNHVHYEKTSCCEELAPKMFIALCRVCHTRTNWNRDYWQSFFVDLITKKYEGKSYFAKSEMFENKIKI